MNSSLKAEVVAIGSEILLGALVDTNTNRIARALREIGLDLFYCQAVGDNEKRITDVLNIALDRSNVVITTGGLGPTVDDMTRRAAAAATGHPLVYSEALERQIAERFKKFDRPMKENNKRQAWIPEQAMPIENPVGTAPCFLSEDANGRGCIIALPGVPRELEFLLANKVVPLLVERMGGAMVVAIKNLRTCAVGECNVDKAIGDFMHSPNPTVGLAVHFGICDIRIAAKAQTADGAEILIAEMEKKIRERLGVAVFGENEETLGDVTGALLVSKNISLIFTDTLTDGKLAEALRHYHTRCRLELTEMDGIRGRDDPESATMDMARQLHTPRHIGLAVLGPFSGGKCYVAAYGPNGHALSRYSLRSPNSALGKNWMVVLALDCVRRVLLGNLHSPAD